MNSVTINLDCFNRECFNGKKLIFSILICIVIYYLTRFLCQLKRYPIGPIPIPIFGNFLDFYTIKTSVFEHFVNLSKKYGPVYTFWMGSRPIVIITDLKIANQSFIGKRNDIAGRPFINYFKRIFESHDSFDIAFNDYGPTWESLRRVAHDGVRKYSVDEKLALLVKDVVSEAVDNIKKNEGINKPFAPYDYLYLTLLNILASSAFGKRYSLNDQEFLTIKKTIESFEIHFNQVFATEFIPFLKLFINKSSLYAAQNGVIELLHLIKQRYKNHQNEYQKGITRDFTDALLTAKIDSIKRSKESAPYLTDNNLAATIIQLFLAGSGTSLDTLRWIILFMANYTDMQRRMRKEIEDYIGDQIPIQEDKNNCHYINAFITESLRHRNTLPLSLPHKTLCDVDINGYQVPKDTIVIMHTFGIMHNPDVFEDPESFKPERFLQSNGKFISTRHPGFIPFGMGRRVCLGEKLALADLFLIVVNLLQLTAGYEFALPDGPGSANFKPKLSSLNCVPNDYHVLLKKIDD